MFYIKVKESGLDLKFDITDENVYTICPDCGAEHQVDIGEILSDGFSDLYGTSVCCPECSKKRGA